VSHAVFMTVQRIYVFTRQGYKNYSVVRLNTPSSAVKKIFPGTLLVTLAQYWTQKNDRTMVNRSLKRQFKTLFIFQIFLNHKALKESKFMSDYLQLKDFNITNARMVVSLIDKKIFRFFQENLNLKSKHRWWQWHRNWCAFRGSAESYLI
jgi:hypothetical protein